MALRIFVGDDDLRRICPELEAELAASKDIWPPEGRGRDGVISAIAADGLSATFTSATGNFKHARGPGKPVKPGALIIVFGLGFYRVAAVVTNTVLTIARDGARTSMAFAFVAASSYQYQVGGFAAQIQDTYEQVFSMPGMCRWAISVESDPLDRGIDQPTLQDKALFCPDTWRGADPAIKWGALRLVLYALKSSDEGVYAKKLEQAQAEWEGLLNALEFVYNDPPDYSEVQASVRFAR